MDEIYREYARTVYKFLLAQCREPDTAEELTQETFYQAVRSIERYDGSCKISVWLCQIGKHLWYRELNRRKKEAPEELCSEEAPSPEELLLSGENQLELLKALHSLPETARELIYLRSFGNLSFREIGEVMGKSENWARVSFYRAKERLKGGLRNEK